jgi:hypothetical protein
MQDQLAGVRTSPLQVPRNATRRTNVARPLQEAPNNSAQEPSSHCGSGSWAASVIVVLLTALLRKHLRGAGV